MPSCILRGAKMESKFDELIIQEMEHGIKDSIDVESTFFKRLDEEAKTDSDWIDGFDRFHKLSFYEKFKLSEFLEHGPKMPTVMAFNCLDCNKHRKCLLTKNLHC